MEPSRIPTLYEWMGGLEAIERLMTRFYERVPADPLLGPVFAHMDPAHASHVSAFVAEVMGGPTRYSAEHGGHAHMIRKHLARGLIEPQRRRWLNLLLDCADELALKDDPEFRSAFIAYLEWGTRLAVINSQPSAQVIEDLPMPTWGWGEVKGPYTGP